MTDFRDDLRRPLAWAVEKILDDAMVAIEEADERTERERSRRLWVVQTFGYWVGRLRFFDTRDGESVTDWTLKQIEKSGHLSENFIEEEWSAFTKGFELGTNAVPIVGPSTTPAV